MSIAAYETEFQFPSRRVARKTREQKQLDTLTIELQAAREREEASLREKDELSKRQLMLAQEFEHRLVNGLQLIVSLLSLQSRTAPTPEAAAQLTIASRRVASLGRVHHRLHLLDHEDHVELKQFFSICARIFPAFCSVIGRTICSSSKERRPRSRPCLRSRSVSSPTN